MKKAISEFDIFYLSYDEPQKEEFWSKLQDICPWAKRVDGVKGFDSAHKACANQSETQHFVTVDGDTLLYPRFLDLELDVPESFKINGKQVPFEEVTLSWASKNIINGLCYGNGGLKLWSRDFVLNMKTHENAVRDEEKVDFCWDSKYIQLLNCYSDTCPNGSPFQAFRAGFREGVKMTLDRGSKAGEGSVAKYVHSVNYKRLLVWATIGSDVENGLWAIYGTRLGIYMANIQAAFDIANISDYDWFKKYFYTEVAPLFEGNKSEKCSRTGQRWDKNALIAQSGALITPLRKHLGLEIADMEPAQSEFFKAAYDYRSSRNPLALEVSES